MSNRCPNCNKFVGLEVQEPEEQSLSVSNEGLVEAEVRLVLVCAECSGEMKETTFNFLEETSPEAVEHLAAHESDEKQEDREEYELSVECSWETEDYYKNTDRNGNPITSMRYMKHMYQITGTVTITCSCGETWEVKLKDEVQASGMDEIN
jgi:hypothetical protein